ncbi:putative kinesin motor domain, P-loop containing nucleoside triphosphate hydrolase [Dioscorea sansibarensis]
MENCEGRLYFLEKIQVSKRHFTIKIYALEIYNEKGTFVEKLEEVAKDGQHLRHLVGICEAQRQVGETSLNDTSSRSYQNIRKVMTSSLTSSFGIIFFGVSIF